MQVTSPATGELPELIGEQRTASVVALTDVRHFVVVRATFTVLGDKLPGFGCGGHRGRRRVRVGRPWRR